MLIRLLSICWLCTVVAAIGGCGSGAGPMVVEPVMWESPDGPVRGWVAEVRLDDPRVEVLVTTSLNESVRVLWSSSAEVQAEAVLMPTDQWAESVGAAVAINANYFAWLDEPGRPRGSSGLADVIGLSISDGVVVSPPRAYAGLPDDVLIFDREGLAHIGPYMAMADIVDAVAGVGASENSGAAVTRLVTHGFNTGKTCRVQPFRRHPRTAVGVDATGRRLLLVVIDGRQPGWSVGTTLPELAEWMIHRGAYDALNLDGGGSSSFVYLTSDRDRTRHTHTNRPSDGSFRPVANHLGIRIHPAPQLNLSPQEAPQP